MSKNHFFAWMGTYCWIYYFSEKSDTKWTTPELKASEKRSGVFLLLEMLHLDGLELQENILCIHLIMKSCN